MILIPLCLATDRVKVKFPFVCFGPLWHARCPWLSFFLHTLPIQVSLWNSQKRHISPKIHPLATEDKHFQPKETAVQERPAQPIHNLLPCSKAMTTKLTLNCCEPTRCREPKRKPSLIVFLYSVVEINYGRFFSSSPDLSLLSLAYAVASWSAVLHPHRLPSSSGSHSYWLILLGQGPVIQEPSPGLLLLQ